MPKKYVIRNKNTCEYYGKSSITKYTSIDDAKVYSGLGAARSAARHSYFSLDSNNEYELVRVKLHPTGETEDI